MNLTLSEIDEYLAESRKYLNNAYHRARRMGWYCPALDRMLTRQEELERIAWIQSHRGEMGWFWLVAAAGSVAAYLGTYVYRQYSESKMQADYLECLETYTSQGIAPEVAAEICSGQGISAGTGQSIQKTVKMVVYGGVIIMALWFGNKLIGKIKK